MKYIFVSIVLFILTPVTAQELQTIAETKYRFSLTYGITAVNPEDINTHIASSNAAFGSTTKSVKSLPELTAALSFRPQNDFKIIILRGGYISSERMFQFSIPETKNNSTPIGTTTGTITETYTAYPISIGVGGTTEKSDAQFQMEFIYGLGYVTEEGSFTSSTGTKTSYTRSIFSPTYGFRVNGSIVVPITSLVGLQFEAGYRYLMFDEFEDEATAQTSPLEFSMSGIQGSLGLSIKL
jgi:hypothetical protein